MRYQGGKTRIAKHIAPFIIGEALQGRTTYIEPFVGSAAITTLVAPYFDNIFASDAMPDLIMMWQALQRGWEPPDELSKEEWKKLKSAEPSGLRAFAGFGVSFGGKWFGGYAAPTTKYASQRVPIRACKQSIMRRIQSMGDVSFFCLDYREVKNTYSIDHKTVIYADPPYSDTCNYAGVDRFNSVEFWNEARIWHDMGARVYISEYDAPPQWECVWEKDTRVSIGLKENRATERLFTYIGHDSS